MLEITKMSDREKRGGGGWGNIINSNHPDLTGLFGGIAFSGMLVKKNKIEDGMQGIIISSGK